MNCQMVMDLLHAYLDEELDRATTLEVEQHLQVCDVCLQEYNCLQALRDALHTHDLSLPAPTSLRERIQLAVRKADETPLFHKAPLFHRSRRFWLSAAALLVILILTTLTFTQFFFSSGHSVLAQQVLASHIRSLQEHHLVDVASSDQHTIKPWFDGKLDYAPPVVDLASQGFPLVGARLDRLDSQSVAALVYQHGKHVLTLFLWPAPGSSVPQVQTLQGYHLCTWTQSGMMYWVTSDVGISELHQFVLLLQQETAA